MHRSRLPHIGCYECVFRHRAHQMPAWVRPLEVNGSPEYFARHRPECASEVFIEKPAGWPTGAFWPTHRLRERRQR